jgi:hypothetical protein
LGRSLCQTEANDQRGIGCPGGFVAGLRGRAANDAPKGPKAATKNQRADFVSLVRPMGLSR